MIQPYRSPLRYPGGKQKLAPFIREVLEENNLVGGHYVEPYAGGAGVAINLLLSGMVSHIHLNDSWVPLYAFWRSVIYKNEEFCQRIKNVPLTVPEWKRQREVLSRPWEFDQFDLGFSMFYLNRCNRSGIIHFAGLIGGLNQDGQWKMDARFPREKLIERVAAIGAKRSSITLCNWDAERFIREHLSKITAKSLVYCDPPYFHKADRLYPNHYEREDHERVARIIQKEVKQRWIVSYDRTPEITRFYENRRMFAYKLQYNVANAYKGRELIIVSDDLCLPTSSSLSHIDKPIRSLAF